MPAEYIATPKPGETISLAFRVGRNLIGDFNDDHRIDVRDIKLLQQSVRGAGSRDARYDLDQDRRVSLTDVRYLVEQVLQTSIGE